MTSTKQQTASTAGQMQLWVARAPLAKLIVDGAHEQGVSGRQLAQAAGLDPKMLRKILTGQSSAWIRLETAEALLAAAGLGDQLAGLDVVCSLRA